MLESASGLPSELHQRLEAAICRVMPEGNRDQVRRALRVACAAHEGQQRKQGAPYIVHPARVALTLLDEFCQDDLDTITASLLHDVLEDAPDRASAGDIETAFGRNTLRLIKVLTSPLATEVPDQPTRNRLKAEKVMAGPREAWYIKIADRIDNLRDAILAPGEAGCHFRRRYFSETVRWYRPIVRQLNDERVKHSFERAVSALEEKIMIDSATPLCITGAGLELDVRRMRLPQNLGLRYGPLLSGALDQMERVERGEIVNVDEGRQVGHYWLRNPAIAPEESRQSIERVLADIDRFHEEKFADQFERILWIGIGGSALGPQMLYEAFRVPGKTPAIFFFDNTDPTGFGRTVREIKAAGGIERTLAVVVSKSGGTKETRNGMLVAKHEFEKAGVDFERSAVAITQAGSELDQLAGSHVTSESGVRSAEWLGRFHIWDWVGGRTSLFSAVGMLAARLLGFDVEGLIAGACAMDEETRDRNIADNPALLLAATWYHAVEESGLRNMVVLPYCDQLATLSKYLQQLVMESLGKDGKGITVYGNKGSTDQHSFVQQLREGYPDFFVTFLRVLVPEKDWEVELGVTAADYLAAFQEGTACALSDIGRRSLRISVECLDERTLGALVALFERAVGYYAALIGINAYHQPGVEAGKQAAGDVLNVQRRLLEHLQAYKGTEFTVGQLAEATNAPPLLVHDILDRLCRAERFGLATADAGGPLPCTRTFSCLH